MAAVWNLTTTRLYYRQFWVIWNKNGSGLKSYHYKVILQTKLSHLGQKWQRFEILPLQDYITDSFESFGTKMAVVWNLTTTRLYCTQIESFGTKMAAVWNLTTTRLYCRQNWVIWDKIGSGLKSHPYKVILQTELSCWGQKWQQSFGKKRQRFEWAHFQIYILQCYFAVRILQGHIFKSQYYKVILQTESGIWDESGHTFKS